MPETEVWSIRLDTETAARVTRLAEALTKRAAGANVSRSHVARMAVERGVEVLEKEIGVSPRRRKRKK